MRTRARTPHALSLLFVLVLLVAGCGSGSDRAVSTATPVAAVRTNVYTAFTASATGLNVSAADAEAAPGGLAIVAEDAGTVRVLDLAAQPVREVRAIAVTAITARGPFLGDLSVYSASTALLCQSQNLFAAPLVPGDEQVFVFSPTGGGTVNAVATGNPVTIATAKDSTGTAVTTFAPTLTASAVIAEGRLFVSSSNSVPGSTTLNPGTVQVFPFDAGTSTVTSLTPAVLVTSHFNPSSYGLTATRLPEGDPVVLCVNAGPYGTGPSSVDVIDPKNPRIVANIPLGAVNAAGRVVPSSDRKRAWIGSQSASELYEVSLEGLAAELANTTVRVRPDLALHSAFNPIPVPTAQVGLNAIASLALSADGRCLYAANFNDATLTVLDVRRPSPAVVRQLTSFRRSGDPANFENNVNFLIPSTDGGPPDVYALVVNLRAADRARTDVRMTLDAVDDGF